MNRRNLLRVMFALAILLVGQAVSVATKAYAAQPDLRAAVAAKSAAGARAPAGADAGNIPPMGAVGTFTTFDVPGAGTGFLQGTFPSAINSAGAITGSFVDANNMSHGFLRANTGAITAIDVPGAAQGTFPAGINPADTIAGSFFDANFAPHGFLRTGTGAITAFDVAGAVFIAGISINPAGAITGSFFDANGVPHGFLRTSSGDISTFDVPGAVNGTQVSGISAQGVITGKYTDAASVTHGFVRASDGEFSTFDVPSGSLTMFAAFSFGSNWSMNPAGTIAGAYFQPIQGNPFGGNFQVFVRAPDGTFTTFAAATYPPCCIWSFPSGITPGGAIVGSLNDGFTVNHGFLRAADGQITTFDAPGAGSGFNQGTAPLGITPDSTIMGLYIDANYVTHGFILTPRPSALTGAN